MPEEENTTTSESEKGGTAGRTAAKAAVAAAATGAAAVAVKKMLDSRSNGSNGSSNGDDDSGAGKRSGDTRALVTSIASGSWDAAQDALVPIAGDVAAAAGKYVAQNGPDVVKDQIVPKFIEAFNEAR